MTKEITLLSPELTEVRDAIREVCAGIAEKYDRAFWVECSKNHRFPEEIWDLMGTQGLLGLGVPEEYGGSGEGIVPVVAAMEAMAANGIPIALYLLTAFSPRSHPASRVRGAEAALRRPNGGWIGKDLLRDHRTERRHQLLQDGVRRRTSG